MSAHDNEELIDYEDDQDVIANGAAVSGTNGGAAATDGDKTKQKNFSGIHSTGFRQVLYLSVCFVFADANDRPHPHP